jgi:predicted dehydrogenase
MTQPLRVGVLGLGRRWQQCYKPALTALRRSIEVRVVCDEIQQRAEREARHLGCHAVVGLTALLESEDIEAVLLLESQWYGLWPLEQLCAIGKPVYCGHSLEFDEAHADGLRERLQATGLPVMMELLPQAEAVTPHLRELLAGAAGPARLLLCEYSHPPLQPSHVQVSAPVFPALLGGLGLALLHWCRDVMGGEPARVLGVGSSAADYGTIFLEYEDGRAARISRHRAAGGAASVRLCAIGERGMIEAHLPRRLRWNDAEGQHALTLPKAGYPEQALLGRFAASVRSGTALEPGFDDAYRALRWLRAAVQSLSQETWIELSPAAHAD